MVEAKCSKGHLFGCKDLPHVCPVCVRGVGCTGTTELVEVKKRKKK